MGRGYKPDWYQNEGRKKHCLNIAEEGERIFRELTGATKGTLEEDKRHIDYFWEGKKVDVKGLKPMHLDGYILVEMINNYGLPGWASKHSEAEYIAFQFPTEFVVVETRALREITILLCDPYDEEKVFRGNFIKPEDGLYKWLGRHNRKDVFTYLTKDDLVAVKPIYISYAHS